MPTAISVLDYIERYRNKATVVRQIHSNIAESKRKWDIRHTLTTIILGAVFTFTGFMGTDRIFDTVFLNGTANSSSSGDEGSKGPIGPPAGLSSTKSMDEKYRSGPSDLSPKNEISSVATNAARNSSSIISDRSTSSKKVFDLIFNGVALLLFIVSILNLIYRWKEDHTAHFQGVVKLTVYINWLDELKLIGVPTSDVFMLKKIRGRYQTIVESLPPNDEKDYLHAKQSLTKKVATTSGRDAGRAEFLTQTILDSQLIMMILRELQAIDGPELWLGGGAIRNTVWDKLTGRITPQDDFDIVYFDAQNLNPMIDQSIEGEIASKLPPVLKISVKNQARMHIVNGEPATNSLEDAISQWPEMATAIAARLNSLGELQLFAPYGLSDILNMTIRPTPYHELHRQSYDARKQSKNWNNFWPELNVY